MSWQPILEGKQRQRALDCILAIERDLLPTSDPTLADGNAGQAIFHTYLGQSGESIAVSEGGHLAAARQCLQRAIAAIADRTARASLFSGLTGVGFALAHLGAHLQLSVDTKAFGDDLAEIDAALLEHIGESPWQDDYDLISGLVGYGVYALERLPARQASACLERIVARLADTAEQRPDGLTWWTNPCFLVAERSREYPNGFYNLGLSHGVPGVIGLLARVGAAGVAVNESRRLLNGAVDWLLAQDCDAGFPAWIAPGESPRSARLAWCYGDPGVAVSLDIAARCCDEPAWEQKALAIARRAADRALDRAGVVDAGLCHGAAGLGHVFNRLFQATGESWLADASRGWLEQAMAMGQCGHGVGGFQAWSLGEEGVMAWVTDSGLLTGAAGIALAFLAAITEIEPNWDRMLMTSIGSHGVFDGSCRADQVVTTSAMRSAVEL
jgi:hypothetical protein